MGKRNKSKHRAALKERARIPPPDEPVPAPGALPGPDDDGMPETEPPALPPAPRWMRAVLWCALALAMLIGLTLHLLHLTTRTPQHDEIVHLQFLWMTSEGTFPREGFLCPYPPTAYYLLGPLLHLVPQKPVLFVFIRACSLLPLAAMLGAICLMARRLDRPPALAAAYLLALIGAGQFMSLWEVRFDVMAWGLCIPALYLLLWPRNRWWIFWASALAFFSLTLSPKHAYFTACLALAFAAVRLLENRRGFPRDVVAALGGALLPVLLMTLIHPAFLVDVVDLTLMNFKAQAISNYPDKLIGSLLRLFVHDPALMSVVWLAPFLFVLGARRQPRRVVILFGGALAGGIATIALLPCGYDQYYTLVWALFAVFVPWAIPERGEVRLSLAVSVALAGLAVFYAVREFTTPQDRKMGRYLAYQEEVARLCPEGETAAVATDYAPWFRRFPGYVIIDNEPSYANFVRPARKRLFTGDYYEQQLAAHPPALFSPVGISPAYNAGAARFYERHGTNYESYALASDAIPGLRLGKMYFLVRKDLTNRAVEARAEPFPAL